MSALRFFSLNANYLISPDATLEDVTSDASCFLESAQAGVQAVIDGIGDPGSQMAANPGDAVSLLFGVLHQVQMARSLANAAQTLRPAKATQEKAPATAATVQRR